MKLKIKCAKGLIVNKVCFLKLGTVDSPRKNEKVKI